MIVADGQQDYFLPPKIAAEGYNQGHLDYNTNGCYGDIDGVMRKHVAATANPHRSH